MTNVTPTPAAKAGPVDLRTLDGRIVLVRTTRDQRNPPSGIRGWLEVRERGADPCEVRVALEFPQMFSRPAHHRTIVLDHESLTRLLASERNGAFEFTIDDELA